MTVPGGHSNSLVRPVQRPYHKASQADSAGSIPVTRSYLTRPSPLLQPCVQPKASRVGPVRRVVIPGRRGAACASQVLPLEQRPRALQRHNQRGENDEGQLDQLIAVMWIN